MEKREEEEGGEEKNGEKKKEKARNNYWTITSHTSRPRVGSSKGLKPVVTRGLERVLP